jgi:prevent-host-death family protein
VFALARNSGSARTGIAPAVLNLGRSVAHLEPVLGLERPKNEAYNWPPVQSGKGTVKASEFKAKCLALIDEVTDTGNAIVITKNGRPLVTIVFVKPSASAAASQVAAGQVKYRAGVARIILWQCLGARRNGGEISRERRRSGRKIGRSGFTWESPGGAQEVMVTPERAAEKKSKILGHGTMMR